MGRKSGVHCGAYLLCSLDYSTMHECQCHDRTGSSLTACVSVQQFVTHKLLPHTQVRQGALSASGSKVKLAEGAFGKVYSLQGCSRPMVVKRVAPDTIATASNTLKEGVLLSALKAAKQDYVPALHDCIVENDTCLLVMDQAPQSLDACLTATVRSRPVRADRRSYDQEHVHCVRPSAYTTCIETTLGLPPAAMG
jgi:hypothetical protein